MSEIIQCPLCGSECEKEDKFECTIFECSKCGRFQIDCFSANEVHLTDKMKLILKCYYNNLGEFDNRRLTVLNSKNIDNIISNINYPKNLVEKVDSVLAYFAEATETFGQIIELNDKNKLLNKFFCSSENELNNIIGYLISVNYIKYTQPNYVTDRDNHIIVTMEGLKYYQKYKEKLFNNRFNSKQGFIAMWFNDKEEPKKFRPNMQYIYSESIKKGIEDAGYETLKIDCKEHCNDINDEMIAEIRKSRFMVADLTGYRGGVYWEAGFAYGLGLPVIYTCHEQWLNSNKDFEIEGVHFDLNHRNIILWNDTEEGLKKFRKDLKNRIEAVVGINTNSKKI